MRIVSILHAIINADNVYVIISCCDQMMRNVLQSVSRNHTAFFSSSCQSQSITSEIFMFCFLCPLCNKLPLALSWRDIIDYANVAASSLYCIMQRNTTTANNHVLLSHTWRPIVLHNIESTIKLTSVMIIGFISKAVMLHQF